MVKDPSQKTYVAALGYPSGMAFRDFDRTTFQAASDAEAKDKATEWAMKKATSFDPQTWLQVTIDGRSIIYSRKMGEPTSAPRP